MIRPVLFAAVLGAVGCGSADAPSTEAATDCGHQNAAKDLSVIDRSYDDQSGAIACVDAAIEIYPGNAGGPGPSGLVPVPSGAPIATARTSSAYADFALSPGDYTVCLAYAERSCGNVTLSGRHIYGAFTGGPTISWVASDDPAQAAR
jgi:hypothetical protein